VHFIYSGKRSQSDSGEALSLGQLRYKSLIENSAQLFNNRFIIFILHASEQQPEIAAGKSLSSVG
jgi:hypothetical protein